MTGKKDTKGEMGLTGQKKYNKFCTNSRNLVINFRGSNCLISGKILQLPTPGLERRQTLLSGYLFANGTRLRQREFKLSLCFLTNQISHKCFPNFHWQITHLHQCSVSWGPHTASSATLGEKKNYTKWTWKWSTLTNVYTIRRLAITDFLATWEQRKQAMNSTLTDITERKDELHNSQLSQTVSNNNVLKDNLKTRWWSERSWWTHRELSVNL